jgi:hypothetical protein
MARPPREQRAEGCPASSLYTNIAPRVMIARLGGPLNLQAEAQFARGVSGGTANNPGFEDLQIATPRADFVPRVTPLLENESAWRR